jgi:hypothetical protein
MIDRIRLFARRYLARETGRSLARMAVWPPVAWVRFGSFRRLKPISSNFGNSRGLEIDRYYIEKFLSEHALDIRGHVLEIQRNIYSLKFGGDRVVKSDILHKIEGNPWISMNEMQRWKRYEAGLAPYPMNPQRIAG